jgi:RimK family alpha-L-glutamate ligase
MRLTVIAKKSNWHIERLAQSAKNSNIDISIVDFKSFKEAKEFNDWGDVVLWRSSSFNRTLELPLLLDHLNKKGIFVVNGGRVKTPFSVFKFFQQEAIREYTESNKRTNINTISTYRVHKKEDLLEIINRGDLKFPFIEKPNLGAHGDGVKKIESCSDIGSVQECVYQNLIKNDGDFRVLCLGGRALGAIKRIAKEGDFRNNVSQGGRVEIVQDEVVKGELYEIALKVVSILNLNFAGVDIIYDQENRKYIFLETNSAPEWKGFENTTQINVGDEVIKYCISIARRKDSENYNLVKGLYEDAINYMDKNNSFHYLSRMHLWFGDNESKNLLMQMESSYIGVDNNEISAKIKGFLTMEQMTHDRKQDAELRLPYIEKYGMLMEYNNVFFKVLFCDKIYQKDIRPIVEGQIKIESMLDLKKRLEGDWQGMATLSTFAINYLYGLENYIYKDYFSLDFINPELYYNIAKDAYVSSLENNYKLRLYFITHCIINESRFYSRKIERSFDVYNDMLKLAEAIINKNYFDIGLDNKLEFLVCARMMNYKTYLNEIIFSETKNSLSDKGNYLIDTLNVNSGSRHKDNIKSSEHRNTLYLMAFGDSPMYGDSF